MKWSIREGSLMTAVAALMVVVQPDILTAVVRAWLVVVALLATGALLQKVFGPILAEQPPRDQSVTARELGLIREMGDNDQAKDFVLAVDYQLFPFLQRTLREIAAQRLLVNHKVVFERDPGRARTILGDDAWRLVRPTPEGSGHPRLDTITIAQLAAVTDALEKV